MSNSPSQNNVNASPAKQDIQASELTELRSLLLGPVLDEQFDNSKIRSEDVSRVLPEAVHHSLNAGDQALINAVVPTVEHAIQSSVNTDQNVLSVALFPIMGPAIRKAIAAAIQNLTDSLNQSLEHSLSPQSISWRFEAWRTGKSFAEVLLLRTLVYQVEQVFLIHKTSGLVLQHLTAETATAQDADLVSAMFTAIQDFVRDSFSLSDETLGSIQVGELTIWVNEGPQALIACVVRGNPPGQLRLTMEKALERIHLLQEQQLQQFQGDSSGFEPSQPYLEECLQSQYQTTSKPSFPLKWIGGVAGMLILGLSFWGMFSHLEQQQVQTFVDQLNQQPGIAVLTMKKQGRQYEISGLKDPLAIQPTDLLTQTDLDPDKISFEWEPYLSFDANFVESRVKSVLRPPDTVTLKFEADGSIQASGTASQSWITEAKKLALRLPTITQFKTQQLIPTESQSIVKLKQKIESQTLYFTQNAQLVPQQDQVLKTLAQDLKFLLNAVKRLGRDIVIQVEGHTDATGLELTNLYVREIRANSIISILTKQGIPPRYFQAINVEPPPSARLAPSNTPTQSNRKVTFQVVFVHPSEVNQ